MTTVTTMPKAMRIGIAGAVFAIAIDYFFKPTITKSLRV